MLAINVSTCVLGFNRGNSAYQSSHIKDKHSLHY